MSKDNHKYKTNIKRVDPDSTLEEEKGWVNMQLRWLIDEETMGAENGVLGYTIFPPGESKHDLHVHEDAEEYIIVTEGKGRQIIGDEEFEFESGDVIFVPMGEGHSTKNRSDSDPLKLFFIYAGAPTLEKAGYSVVS